MTEKLAKIKEEYGPEALVASEGTYRSDALWVRSRFFNLLGNPGNVIAPGSVCWCWNYTINMSMCGWPLEVSNPVDPMHCNTFVMWGVRTNEKYGPKAPLWRNTLASFNRQGYKPKMITIDPACTATGMIGDQWLAIRPGTDLIMMLAWINYIIELKYYDEDFLVNLQGQGVGLAVVVVDIGNAHGMGLTVYFSFKDQCGGVHSALGGAAQGQVHVHLDVIAVAGDGHGERGRGR